MTVSLSHRAGLALCTVAPAGVALGCDLEPVEPRSDAFVADYLTPAERALVERDGPSTSRVRLAVAARVTGERGEEVLDAGLHAVLGSGLERTREGAPGRCQPPSVTFSTAAPVKRPCERSMSALSASSSGYGLVVTLMPIREAMVRNSSPSTLVFAVTERRRFS